MTALRALTRLKNCENVLKIDDVLSLFPDFTVIEDFKVLAMPVRALSAMLMLQLLQAEISSSLETSSKKLQELREDMKDFTDSAERIRQDIKTLRYRCARAMIVCTSMCLQLRNLISASIRKLAWAELSISCCGGLACAGVALSKPPKRVSCAQTSCCKAISTCSLACMAFMAAA